MNQFEDSRCVGEAWCISEAWVRSRATDGVAAWNPASGRVKAGVHCPGVWVFAGAWLQLWQAAQPADAQDGERERC